MAPPAPCLDGAEVTHVGTPGRCQTAPVVQSGFTHKSQRWQQPKWALTERCVNDMRCTATQP